MIDQIILNPTTLQARHESDGTFTATVRQGPSSRYLSDIDYFNAAWLGDITIHTVDVLPLGRTRINYSTN